MPLRFAIYVHLQGPSSPLSDIARRYGWRVNQWLEDHPSAEIDGLVYGFHTSSAFYTGMRSSRKRVRRSYNLRSMTTQQVTFYNCLVELDATLADGEVIDAALSESSLYQFIQQRSVELLPIATKGFPQSELAHLSTALSLPQLELPPRW
jgi:hypothetical protein